MERVKERERIQRKFENPNVPEPEITTREEKEETLGNILKANIEFEQMTEEIGRPHLSLSLINASFDIYQIQQNIETLQNLSLGNRQFLLTIEDARKLSQPIGNLPDRIHHFVYEILHLCGGEKGVMHDLHRLSVKKD